MATEAFKIAPSILSADFAVLGDQIKAAEQGGADLFHLDVMDGHFVPNLTFGPFIVETIRRITTVPLESHLMISNADRYLSDYVNAGSNIVTVHAEACPDVRKTLRQIRSLGAQSGLALNPATPFTQVTEWLPDTDLLLVMTVNPGFAGQKFMAEVLPKIAAAAEYKRAGNAGYVLAVDGGIGAGTAEQVVAAGGEMLVAASAIFKAGDIAQAVRDLRSRAVEAQ